MDDSERIADLFLRSAGHESVVFEPRGNSTPDFLVDDHIAVEVRRLNQNYIADNRYEGLESVQISLFRRLKRLLESFGPPINGNSWWVYYTINRPMPKWRALEATLRAFFIKILEDNPTEKVELELRGGFAVEVWPAQIPLKTALQIGGYSDDQAGGFVTYELIENIKICIEEKTKKVFPFKLLFSDWWLVLVDRTGLGMDADDLVDIRKRVVIPELWEHVYVVHPSSPEHPIAIK